MNKSIFGQWMASVILVIPMVIFGWLVFSPHSASSHSDGTITTVATWMFSAILIAAALYFAIALAWKHREKGREFATGVQTLLKRRGTDKGLTAEELKEKHEAEDATRRLLYIALAFIGYAEFHLWGTAIAIIVGAHLIWLLYPKKGSWVAEAVVVYGILAFFVVGWMLPDVVKIRDASYKVTKKAVSNASIKAETFADDYEKGATSADNPSQQATIPKKFVLTREWSKPYRSLPSGGKMGFGCTEPGSQMKIDFDSAENSLIAPGEIVPCPVIGQPGIFYGDKFVNARYYFQSDNGGDLYIQGAM